MQPRLRFFLVLSALVLALAIGAWADESNVRIVRLSYVNGQVDLDRDGSSGLDAAFLNMPLANGAELVTEDDGYAEVEFEAGSTVRLTPRADMHFRRLGTDDGYKVTTLELVDGTAYFNVKHEGRDEFHVLLNGQELRVPKSSRFRVVMRPEGAQVSVFNGELRLLGEEEIKIRKSQTLVLDFRGPGSPVVSDSIETLAYDAWNEEREGYTGRYVASGSYLGYSSGFSYGWQDLNYFGSFFDVAGYGSCWRPYGYDQYWDPYMDGAWVWYPGWGYTWVSGYPWGWAPYRYGRWIFVSGYGWVWQPGHRWNRWYAYAPVYNPPNNYRHPRPPEHPPIVATGGGIGGGHPRPRVPGTGGPVAGGPGTGGPGTVGHGSGVVVVGHGPFTGRGPFNGGGAIGVGHGAGSPGTTGGQVATGGGGTLPSAITPGVLPNRDAVIYQLRRIHGDDLGVRANVGAREQIQQGSGATMPPTVGGAAIGGAGTQTQVGAGTQTPVGGGAAAAGSGGQAHPPQIVITPSHPNLGSGGVQPEQQQHVNPAVIMPPQPARHEPPPQQQSTPPPSSSPQNTGSAAGSGSRTAVSGGPSGGAGSGSHWGGSSGGSSSSHGYAGGSSSSGAGSSSSSGGSHSGNSSSGSSSHTTSGSSSGNSSSSGTHSSGGSHDPK